MDEASDLCDSVLEVKILIPRSWLDILFMLVALDYSWPEDE